MIDILRVPIRYKKWLDRLSNEDKGYVFWTLLSMCEWEVPELREDYIGDMVSLIFRDCNMINDKAEVGKQSWHLWWEYGKLWGRPKKPPQGVNVKPPTPFSHNPRKERKGIEEKGIERNTDTNTCVLFDTFWKEYPNKIWKPNALKKYKDKHHTEIMEGLSTWKEYWEEAETEQRFIPHPSTWLNQERWKDEPPEAEQKEKIHRFVNILN